jgi:hypothetical protein
MFAQSLWLSNFGCKYHSLMVRWCKEDETAAAELKDEHRQGK